MSRQYVLLGSTLNLLTYNAKGFSGEVDEIQAMVDQVVVPEEANLG